MNNTTHETTTNTTITNITNNNSNNPESNPEPQPDYSLNYQTSSLPDVPDFYEPAYPDGLSGIHTQVTQDNEENPMMAFLQNLATGIPTSGTCPQWTLDFGALNLGTHNLSPPCSIWSFIQIILLVTTLFLVRAIIFGG